MGGTVRGMVVSCSTAVVIFLGMSFSTMSADAAIVGVTEATCRGCHSATAYNHHSLRLCKRYSCTVCHKLVASPSGGYTFEKFRNCLLCHSSSVHQMSCTICHPDLSFSDQAGRGREMHGLHRDKTTCGVCHEIPATVPLGPREAACGNLCHEPKPIGSAKEIHATHTVTSGVMPQSCSWCHGLNAPRPVNPCDLCHTGISASATQAHKEHARQVECTVCHASVGRFYDVRTSSENLACSRCHEPREGCSTTVHFVHTPEKAQCYACHGGSNIYASSRGRLDCTICHDAVLNPFRAAAPAEVHRIHAARGMMCAACHEIAPAASGAKWDITRPCPSR